ncbi:zinc ribbon domain-containing protein [Neobacillus mesonae]|uniref:zinc ribbon domain-containing protein n=1 Tax=Neobacillus mesonae TaxID=1193713 RepID=UPI00203B6D8A|nr:zinc ribbon domain-containing protein [Neobacillus mesonae]MCM3568998.1 zinc ribbon domain-containing protein [Neobacillus mesonae]
MYCKTCGAENSESANYCMNDGALLKSHTVKFRKKAQSSAYCSSCGETISSLENYCQNCGESLITYGQEKGIVSKLTLEPVKEASPKVTLGKLPSFQLQHIKSVVIPALLAIIVVFALSFFALKSSERVYTGLMEDAMQESDFGQYLGAEGQSMIGKVVGVTDIFMMSNLQNPNITVKASGDISFGGQESISVDLLAKNGLLIYLLFPFIGLLAAGIYAGRKTRGLDLPNRLVDAAGIAIIYSIFSTIISLFAGFSYHTNLHQMGMSLSLEMNTHYSFFKTFLITLLIGFVFSSFGILFSTNFKRITGHLSKMVPFGEAIHQAIAVPIRGILILFVLFFVYFMSLIAKFKEQLGFEIEGTPLAGLLDKSYTIITGLSLQFGTYLWNLLNFSSLTFTGQEDQDKGTISYHVFTGIHGSGEDVESDLEDIAAFITSYDIGVYAKFALVIPIVLLIWAGIRIASQPNVMKSLVVFSGLYAVIMMVIASFADVGFSFTSKESTDDPYSFSMMLGFSPFSTLICSFIFSFVLAYAGTWINRLRVKN